MGKLHYVNRKIEGFKLAQVVAKDLLKRIPPGSGHKAALRDPSVDFDVSGKALTDDAFGEIVDALTRAISYSDNNGRVAKVEELCLKGNQLTVRSLRLLAQVIGQSALDIRDLDVSNNNIAVNSRQDAEDWGIFLTALDGCCVLRRIDLSNNILGSKAFEILARLYLRRRLFEWCLPNVPGATESTTPFNNSPSTEHATTSRNGSDQSIRSPLASPISSSPLEYNPSSSVVEDRRRSSNRGSLSSIGEKAAERSSSIEPIYDTETGLHSVPYIVLSETGIDDTSALYLSYVITSHALPENLLPLVPPVKAGLPMQYLETYDKMPWCRGIIHHPNSDIGVAGAKLLELAEGERGGSYIMPANDLPERTQVPGAPYRSPSLLQNVPSTPVSRRKGSGSGHKPRKSVDSTSVTSQPTPIPKAGELERVRSRIQVETLKNQGPPCNDLWFTSLRMLRHARALLLLPPSLTPTTRREPKQRQLHENFDEQFSLHEFPKLPNSSYASRMSTPRPSPLRPLAPGNPNAPVVLRQPKGRKESSSSTISTSSPLSDASVTSPVPGTPFNTPEKFSQSEPTERPYRSVLLGGLNQEIWAHIISQVIDVEDLLSNAQRYAIIAWASDRDTLSREMEALGKPEAMQIWRVLDGMGCLAYQSD